MSQQLKNVYIFAKYKNICNTTTHKAVKFAENVYEDVVEN